MGSFPVINKDCLGCTCFAPGDYQIRGATGGGSSKASGVAKKCLTNAYRGCPDTEEEYKEYLKSVVLTGVDPNNWSIKLTYENKEVVMNYFKSTEAGAKFSGNVDYYYGFQNGVPIVGSFAFEPEISFLQFEAITNK